MNYATNLIQRRLVTIAHDHLRKVDDGDGVLQPNERNALAADFKAAAEQTATGGDPSLGQVLTAYSKTVKDAFASVNLKGAHWLSMAETQSLVDANLKARVLATRVDMKSSAQGAEDFSVDDAGLHRRQLSDRFVYDQGGPVRVVFVDADSTLRVSKSGSFSANGPRDVQLLPFVAHKLRQFADDGYLIAVVSNQGGVGAGMISIEDADAAICYTAQLIRRAGGEVHYLDFADQRDEFRKPDIGMATTLEKNLTAAFGPEATIDKVESIMVGDAAYKRSETRPDGRPGFNFSNSDRGFAENLGIDFEEPQHFFGWTSMGTENFIKQSQVQNFWAKLSLP